MDAEEWSEQEWQEMVEKAKDGEDAKEGLMEE